MEFIEGRIDLEKGAEGPEALGWLSGLLAGLNRACRTAFARSISQNIDPRLLTEGWAKTAGCFVRLDGSDARPTSHQEKMVARHAKNLRTTANAKAKWASGNLGKLDFADKKIQLRYEASPKAAFAIARKAVLSRGKDVKRGKRPEGWVDLHAKPERLDGLASAACRASRRTVVMKVVKQGGPAQTPDSPPGRRSTPPAGGSAERRLSPALGSDRGLWPHRLKASAPKEQGSKSPAQAARRRPGKGGGAGDIGLPPGSLEIGESRISTIKETARYV